MSRLVVVSNRVPSLTDGKCTGGLAVALKSVLEEYGGLWFGWSGRLPETSSVQPKLTAGNGISLATLDLLPKDFEGYYVQHANRALWPLLHGRTDLSHFDRKSYELYRKVNRKFADGLKSLLADGDMIWVHDYHLIPLGTELRRRDIRSPLGFFMHTPFPAPEVLCRLPCFRDILEELTAYDVVGFQTTNCLQNYKDAVARYLHGTIAQNKVSVNGQACYVACYPIGIDTAALANLAESRAVQRLMTRLREYMGSERWVVGVERLDYTKGLEERFNAFETLLTDEQNLRGKLSLVQVAAPSRQSVAEYRDLQTRLECLSGHINGRLGDFDWTPIRYLNRSFTRQQLAALFRVSRVGLVTPLRDGMNLVAKEYVAAQDPDDPGVLVLSCFAGAADELDTALIVNPHDTADVAAAVKQALDMPLEERKARWRPMMKHLLLHDVHRWARHFLADLSSVETTELPEKVATHPRDTYARLLEAAMDESTTPMKALPAPLHLDAKARKLTA